MKFRMFFLQFGLQQLLNAQFILHASLDVFEEKYKSSKELFLKEIEQKQDYRIFGYVTPSNIRFLILTDQEEEKVKGFCQLAHEQLIKVLMNPLYQLGSSISSSNFDHVKSKLQYLKLKLESNKNDYNLIIASNQIIII